MWSLYAVQRLSAPTPSDNCTLLLTVHMRTVCAKAEWKNRKQKQTWLKGLLLEEGKLADGGTSIACIVSHHYSGIWHHAGLL